MARNRRSSYHVNDELAVTLAARYSGPQFSTLDNSDPNGFAYQGASKYFTTMCAPPIASTGCGALRWVSTT